MSEIIFGTTEHVAGLSRKALEEDFQWVNDRRMELEGECERLDADNAKLREQIHWLKKGDILHVLTDQEYIDQCERERLMQVSIDALDKENAKLRELCAGLLTGYECGYGELCKGCTWDGLGDSKTFSCLPRVKARELGVEQ